jgi:hypothetical protein
LWHTVAVALMVCAPPLAGDARAQEVSAAPQEPSPRNKLTLAYYNFSSPVSGFDLNLRHTFESTTGWIGVYRQADGFDQVRAGYEYDYHHDWVTFVPSVQAATHGFVGATVYAEVGAPFFAIGGAGRTNLKPYWNLGFDPNDYVQFGAGYRGGATTLLLYAIHDNRRDTGQTNTHIYVRRFLPGQWRLTADVVRERGNGDDGISVNGWSASVDVEWRRWFVRMAEDPHVNYTADHQFRLATGVKF